jgi:hypothetical protein
VIHRLVDGFGQVWRTVEGSSEGQHAVNLTGFSGQTFLYKVDDEPTLRSASFARGLTDPFVERTGKRDVLSYVRYHTMIIHTEIMVVHTVALSEAIDGPLDLQDSGGEIAPSWRSRARSSRAAQCSMIKPSAIRKMWMCFTE